MDHREGTIMGSGRTVNDGRHVSQGRDGDELGENKGNGFNIGLHFGKYWRGGV